MLKSDSAKNSLSKDMSFLRGTPGIQGSDDALWTTSAWHLTVLLLKYVSVRLLGVQRCVSKMLMAPCVGDWWGAHHHLDSHRGR